MFLDSRERIVTDESLGAYPVREDRYACSICGRQETVTSPLSQRPLVAPAGWWYVPYFRQPSGCPLANIRISRNLPDMRNAFLEGSEPHRIIAVRACSAACRDKLCSSRAFVWWCLCKEGLVPIYYLQQVAEKTVDDAVVRVNEPLKVWGHRDQKGRKLQVAGDWDSGSLDGSTVDDVDVLAEDEAELLIQPALDEHEETTRKSRKGKWRRKWRYKQRYGDCDE